MIFKGTLRRLCGEATINETRGYLFEQDDCFRFAYRLPEGIVVDEIKTTDRMRMWRWFGRLIGYKLSGQPTERNYRILEPYIPSLPVLETIPAIKDFERLDKRVVLYGSRLAVVQDNEMVHRDVCGDLDPETRIPNGIQESIKMLKVFGENGSVVVRETVLTEKHQLIYTQADILLRRNGI